MGYCKTESMPDYKCTNCQQKGGCAKSMSIQTLPQTLCLHLKRFEADEVAKDINLNKDAQHKPQIRMAMDNQAIKSMDMLNFPLMSGWIWRILLIKKKKIKNINCEQSFVIRACLMRDIMLPALERMIAGIIAMMIKFTIRLSIW